jgi:hypothetical protein
MGERAGLGVLQQLAGWWLLYQQHVGSVDPTWGCVVLCTRVPLGVFRVFDALGFWAVPCFLCGLCVPCLLTLGPARLVVDGWQGGVQSSVSRWGPVHAGLPRQLSRHGGGLLLATWRSRPAATFAALAVQLAALHACRPPDPAGCAAPRPGLKPLALQVSADVGVGFFIYLLSRLICVCYVWGAPSR